MLKGTFASVSLEPYEIACYDALIAMAEACDDRFMGEICRQNLRQERPWPSSSAATSSR